MLEEKIYNPKNQDYVKKNFKNSFKFRLLLFKILPMGFLSGMRIKELNEEECIVTVPYKWINKNPFKSTFWAVLGMAAEMSSGALIVMYIHGQKPTISLLVSKCESEFVKKAADVTTFTCNDGLIVKEAVTKAIKTGEAVTFSTSMTGKNKAGEDVAYFKFTWALKKRSK